MSANAAGRTRVRAHLIVVEDNFSIANSLKYLLLPAGYEVVGVAGSVVAALDLVATVRFDLALLDIDLGGERASSVADAVQHQGRPVVFLSGYGEIDMLPPHLRGLPRLEKPVDPDELFAVLERELTITPDE